ncbi:type IV pilin [Halalkaliarchaeum sp. AArc-GB]|uniref:type IV pilin n=1 Tax=Halalkaliarchaeum sp. AArc-GB TaxID=3074078 RepID=UPI002857A60C|nr:type IV pilin [Halalkaliarchaeum sp. AArc-GB]MDR5673319.1 type IV pilin [Halalkaliarchaeum sp. AArc-GB]
MTTVDANTGGTNRATGSTDRAQSETIGSVLLLALVVILVSTVGLAGLAAIGTFTPTEPAASVGVDGVVDGEELALVVVHEGGDALSPDEIVLLVGEGQDRQRLEFADATGDDATFRPGDRRELTAAPFDPPVRVLVIHASSGATLGDGTITGSDSS